MCNCPPPWPYCVKQSILGYVHCINNNFTVNYGYTLVSTHWCQHIGVNTLVSTHWCYLFMVNLDGAQGKARDILLHSLSMFYCTRALIWVTILICRYCSTMNTHSSVEPDGDTFQLFHTSQIADWGMYA